MAFIRSYSPPFSFNLHLHLPSFKSKILFKSNILVIQGKELKNCVCFGEISSAKLKRSPLACRSMGMKGELRVFENVEELSTTLADHVAELSEAAVKDRGAFAVVLSGGSLISTLGKLTEAPYKKTVDWAKWHVFWVDERVVAKNHPDSNYKLAKDGFLSKVPIMPGHVYAINDSLSAERAAEDYAFGLRQLVKTRTVDVAKITDCPKFDLMLLGMGPDGHIASLFPNHPLINVKDEWVTFITDSPKPPPERITFTLPVINSASNVVMVVTGAGKADTLRKVFEEELPWGALPAQMLSPVDGNLVWFVDKEAASKLSDRVS